MCCGGSVSSPLRLYPLKHAWRCTSSHVGTHVGEGVRMFEIDTGGQQTCPQETNLLRYDEVQELGWRCMISPS